MRAAVEDSRTDRALEEVFAVVEAANGYIEANAPWKLLGKEPARLESILGALVAAEREVAKYLAPFLPATAAELERRLGGGTFVAGPPLFPKAGQSSRAVPASRIQ